MQSNEKLEFAWHNVITNSVVCAIEKRHKSWRAKSYSWQCVYMYINQARCRRLSGHPARSTMYSIAEKLWGKKHECHSLEPRFLYKIFVCRTYLLAKVFSVKWSLLLILVKNIGISCCLCFVVSSCFWKNSVIWRCFYSKHNHMPYMCL